jgi:hypothetical protein
MLLFTQRNAIDTRLTLVSNAIILSDIVDFRSSDERMLSFVFSILLILIEIFE